MQMLLGLTTFYGRLSRDRWRPWHVVMRLGMCSVTLQKENAPHMALVAPTWRGPLPTMMNGKRPDWMKSVRAAVGNPTVGQALYNLNMNERVVEMELARHCGGHDDALEKCTVQRFMLKKC
jgi:hypothetical protein